MQRGRLIRDAITKALEAYQAELDQVKAKEAELQEKIAGLKRELEQSPGGSRKGQGLPFTEKDVAELKAKVSDLNAAGKNPIDAARLIYRAAGKPLHAFLAYRVLVEKGFKIGKKRPEDYFASYLRKYSQEFRRVDRGIFELKITTAGAKVTPLRRPMPKTAS